MNKVILIGRLARDVELRATSTNKSVASFTMAVNRPYNPNIKQQETDFINCISWGKQAENLHKYCQKGSQIAIEGRIQTRNYTDRDGSRKYVTEVLCDNITFLGSKKEDKTPGDEVVEQIVNNMAKQEKSDPFADFGEEVIINDEDLPF